MMQMIRALDAVLFRSRKTKLATPAYPAGKPYADIASHSNIVIYTRSELDDPANTFVAANVREFDLRYGLAIRSSSDSGLGMEVLSHVSVSIPLALWHEVPHHFDRLRCTGLLLGLHCVLALGPDIHDQTQRHLQAWEQWPPFASPEGQLWQLETSRWQ
jgi:hypothetical protein